MIYIYRFLINIIILLSPLIILIRLIKKKEDIKRFKEKFSFFSKKRRRGKLIWFHADSVGELLSIISLIKKMEKNKKMKEQKMHKDTRTMFPHQYSSVLQYCDRRLYYNIKR